MPISLSSTEENPQYALLFSIYIFRKYTYKEEVVGNFAFYSKLQNGHSPYMFHSTGANVPM